MELSPYSNELSFSLMNCILINFKYQKLIKLLYFLTVPVKFWYNERNDHECISTMSIPVG